MPGPINDKVNLIVFCYAKIHDVISWGYLAAYKNKTEDQGSPKKYIKKMFSNDAYRTPYLAGEWNLFDGRMINIRLFIHNIEGMYNAAHHAKWTFPVIERRIDDISSKLEKCKIPEQEGHQIQTTLVQEELDDLNCKIGSLLFFFTFNSNIIN